MPNPKDTPSRPRSKHELRSSAMQARICEAAVTCLDRHGYAETTLARIQAEAGVSRGALMYHFADRTEIMVATADRLLAQSMRPISARTSTSTPRDLRQLLQEVWRRVVDTAGGRAMLEILVACRTDTALQTALSPRLRDWDRSSLEATALLFTGSGADSDDAELLWSIARSFVRGLIVHEQFTSSPDYARRMLHRFADLLEPHLQPR